MADKRISQLVERTDIANNDVVPIVAFGATTTNKATISSIQEFMQENLDLGVTSVGITLGTTGTDVNVTGSPITTSGNITINIPNASATARGVVTTGSQVFGGVKTFSNGFILPSAGGTNQAARFVNIGTIHEGSAGSTQIGFNNSNNIYFGKGLSNGGVIQWTNAAVRYYTLPDADGTIALASQLDGYVTLGTAQTITGQKTFNSTIVGQDATLTSSGSGQTLLVTHSSGSGIALDISKGGNGEGLRVTKTSGSGNAVTITGGALSAVAGQFSGDLQSATRVIASATSQSIILTPNSGGTTNRVESVGTLPLSLVSAAAITMAAGGTTPQITLATGGGVTLTGALNGTSATFIGNILANGSIIAALNNGSIEAYDTDNANYFNIKSSGGNFALRTNMAGTPVNALTINTDGSAFFNYPVLGSRSFVFRTVSGRPLTLETVALTGIHSFYLRANDSGRHLISSNYLSGGAYLPLALSGRENDTDFVLNAGNVGIGTASPANYGGWGGLDVRGTNGGHIIVANTGGTQRGEIFTDGNGFSVSAQTNIAMLFKTNDTERMRITSGGFLKASNTGSYLGSTGTFHELRSSFGNSYSTIIQHSDASLPYGLGVFYTASSPNSTNFEFIYCQDSTQSKFIVWSNGSVVNRTGSYGTISDIKFKENVVDASPKLDDILKLKVRNFNLIGEEQKQIGFIAQEFEEVFPSMVDVSIDKETEEEYKSIKTSVLIPMLVKAIQEQQEQINQLKNQINK